MEINLPPWKIFTKAISLIWEKRNFAVLICLPVLLFVALLALSADLGLISEVSASALQDDQVPSYLKYSYLAGSVTAFVIFTFFLAVIAVYWHRSILLQENSVKGVPLRFDAVLWRYIGYGAIIVLVWVSCWIAIGVAAGMVSDATQGAAEGNVILAVLFIPFFIFLGIVFFRLGLVLPAAAIGQRGIGFGAAWKMSRGSNLRLLALNLLAALFGFVVGFITSFFGKLFELVLANFVGKLPQVVTVTAQLSVNLIFVLFGISVLSVTYAYLAYEGPRGGAVAAE